MVLPNSRLSLTLALQFLAPFFLHLTIVFLVFLYLFYLGGTPFASLFTTLSSICFSLLLLTPVKEVFIQRRLNPLNVFLADRATHFPQNFSQILSPSSSCFSLVLYENIGYKSGTQNGQDCFSVFHCDVYVFTHHRRYQ